MRLDRLHARRQQLPDHESFQQRFVGATELPRTLTDIDVGICFRLSVNDVDALHQRFRGQRLGAAVLLVFMRATRRPLQRLGTIPVPLLKYLCSELGVSQTSIAPGHADLCGRQVRDALLERPGRRPKAGSKIAKTTSAGSAKFIAAGGRSGGCLHKNRLVSPNDFAFLVPLDDGVEALLTRPVAQLRLGLRVGKQLLSQVTLERFHGRQCATSAIDMEGRRSRRVGAVLAPTEGPLCSGCGPLHRFAQLTLTAIERPLGQIATGSTEVRCRRCSGRTHRARPFQPCR